jgi:hypothetical protein
MYEIPIQPCADETVRCAVNRVDLDARTLPQQAIALRRAEHGANSGAPDFGPRAFARERLSSPKSSSRELLDAFGTVGRFSCFESSFSLSCLTFYGAGF